MEQRERQRVGSAYCSPKRGIRGGGATHDRESDIFAGGHARGAGKPVGNAGGRGEGVAGQGADSFALLERNLRAGHERPR